MKLSTLGKGLVLLLLSNYAVATDAPSCLEKDQSVLSVNSSQVLDWKANTENEYHDRANVQGTITQLYANATGHQHFELQIGPGAQDTIEIIYDMGFGKLPKLEVGMNVQACGDYITSNASYQSYPASPDGALIHWVHWSNTKSHPSGFLMINDGLYGQRHSVLPTMEETLIPEIAR